MQPGILKKKLVFKRFKEKYGFGYLDIYLYDLKICRENIENFGLHKNDKIVALKRKQSVF